MNVEVFATIAGLLGLSGVVGTVLSRYVRPKATPLEMLQEIQEERGEDRRRLDACETRIGTLERHVRVWEDYAGQLRRHIDNQLGPPPPPYPESLL